MKMKTDGTSASALYNLTGAERSFPQLAGQQPHCPDKGGSVRRGEHGDRQPSGLFRVSEKEAV